MFWVGLGIGVVVGANLGVIMISLFKINKH
jgi:hypothetical protein